MADAEDVKPATDVVGEVKKEKVWNDSEVQEIIKQRDSAKKKAQAREESDKAVQDAKMIEEGKTKELLAQREAELVEAKKQAQEFATYKESKREQLLSKLSDDDKVFTDGMTLDKLELFVEKQTKQTTQATLPTGQWKPGSPLPRPKSKNAAENAAFLRSQGLAD